MLWLNQIVAIIIVIATAPLVMGIAQVVKARMQGRRGPSAFQGYRVLLKLWTKDTTVPEYSSWVFLLAPTIELAALIILVSTIPWTGTVPAGWPHNLITVFFLLALERFWTGLAGMDSAGTFGGLGASRLMTIGTGVEPAMLASFGIFWVLARSTSIQPLAPLLAHRPLGMLLWGLAALSYGMVIIAEAGRLPVDNMDTHLELTMQHEATVLEYSGRLLAQTEATEALKLSAIIGLGWVWLGPHVGSALGNIGLLIVALLASGAAIGWMESRFTKFRYFQLPRYLAMAAGIGILAFYLALPGGLG